MVEDAWPGVDPAWSRYLDVPSTSGVDPAGTVHRWHVLDNGAELAARGTEPVGTLFCVHGNPTWSYLWRTLLAAGTSADRPWRVIAVDQLDMGFSARTGTFRRLADRINDLGDLTGALNLSGPVVTAGHDWGGVISLGWALAHRNLLAGVVLTNTAVHQPPQYPIPAALRLALHPAVHGWGTRTTAAFLRVTHALAHPALSADVRGAFMAPYRSVDRRAGVGNFVADIPASPDHPSFPALTAVAEGIRGLDVPALLLWGPRDPVFSDRYLRDLIGRLPQARVHRFEGAGHLLHEDVDVASAVFGWLGELAAVGPSATARPVDSPQPTPEPLADFVPLWAELERRAGDGTTAVVDMAPRSKMSDKAPLTLSWAGLHSEVQRLARGLTAAGVRPGQRVSLLVPPGSELTALIYACLRLGAIIVLADAGLGAKGLSRAIAGAGPDVVIGIPRALVAARAFRWPGMRLSLDPLPAPVRKALGVHLSLAELDGAASTDLPPEPEPDTTAAILFTSGSTGPAKGVLYTHRQLAAMRDTLRGTYGLTAGTGLVAGFAPFALLGPALGATSVTPDMDVTAPRTLTAATLAEAAHAIDATAVFVSPAALRNVLDTADALTEEQRRALGGISLLLSAGAPIPADLLRAASALMPAARLHTPYGMTEALPVTDIDLDGIDAAVADAANGSVPGAGNGVCVGMAVPGARIAIAALDGLGRPAADLGTTPGITGEIVISAPHRKNGYDRLWLTQRLSEANPGWHRTGDVGHLDGKGRLWVEGRLAHVLSTADGVRTPVAAEHLVEQADGVSRAAVVGVGPAGAQVAVAVVETVPAARRPMLAPASLARKVREAVAGSGTEPAAVLVVPRIPTDIRHNAKVDRSALAGWAAKILAGGPMKRP